jgi:MFS family permease
MHGIGFVHAALGQPMTQKRLFYGWRIVIALAITEPISWGVQYYALAVFLRPMGDELGWSRSQMTGAFSLALLISGLAAVPFGRWMDRHGTRLLMTAGSVVATLLVLAWSHVQDLRAFYLVWVGLGLTMAATFYEPAFVAVTRWFNRRRNRALTVLTLGGALASPIFIPLANWLVDRYGWRDALVILATGMGCVTIPLHALVLRRRPADLGLNPDGDESSPSDATITRSTITSATMSDALHGSAFWWLTAAFFLGMLATVSVGIHLIPSLTDRGFDSSFAALVTGALGAMSFIGRVIFGPLSERLPRQWSTALIFAIQVLGLVVLELSSGKTGVLVFVALFGMGGAVTPARAALLADFYGPAEYGAISGVMAMLLTLARAIAPLGASLLHDATGGYDAVFWTLALLCGLAAVAVLVADRDESTAKVLLAA